MNEINIATAQFQTQNGDKEYNLSRIEKLTKEAAGKGAHAVSFHELCITRVRSGCAPPPRACLGLHPACAAGCADLDYSFVGSSRFGG